MNRTYLAGLLVCALALPVFSAGQGEQGGKSSPGGNAVITYTTWRSEDRAAFQVLIEKFQKENPNITIKYEPSEDATAYYATLKANLIAGTGPDVFDNHPNNDFVMWAKEGLLADLSGLDFIKTYAPGPKAMTTVDGKVYGYNHGVNMILFIYNREIYKSLGLSIPKNYADLVATVKKLKENGYGGIAYCGGDVKSQWLWHALAIEEMGAESYKALIEGIDKGQITTVKDNKIFYETLKTLSRYAKDQLFYDSFASIKYPQALSLFAQKKAAIMMMGTWTFGSKDNDYPGIDQGIFALPTQSQANIAYAEAAQISLVNAKSKNVEAAKKWVNFMATPENSSIYITKTKMTPTVMGVKADFPSSDILIEQMKKGMVVQPIWYSPNKDLWDSSYWAMSENILFNGADVDSEVAVFEAALKKADIKNKK
jgi:raffinose/stachyose/melibiose transport system substrate-binding protein